MQELASLPPRRRSKGQRPGTPEKKVSIGDLVNMYRHRRSVTDTYLGTGEKDLGSNIVNVPSIMEGHYYPIGHFIVTVFL